MGICGKCVYWKKAENKKNNFLTEHIVFDIGNCIGPAERNFDVRDMKADQMAVQCGHDGGITTGLNFGCIHFEA